MRTVLLAVLLTLGAAAPVLAGTRGADRPPTSDLAPMPAVPIAQKLTADQERARTTLAGKLEGNRFAWDLIREPTNAPLFLSLAAQAGPARLVAAALHAVGEAYAPEPVPHDRAALVPDVRTVVLARLAARHREVQAEAFAALTPLVGGRTPDEAVLAHLTGLLKKSQDVAVRYEAVQALGRVGLQGMTGSLALPDADLTACGDAEPVVRITALNLLATLVTSSAFVQHAGVARIQAVVHKALRDKDVATRVVAASVLGQSIYTLGQDRAPQVQAELAALLGDAQAPVRAAAAMALGRHLHPPAWPMLRKLLEDQGDVVLRVQGPPGLDGRPIEFPVAALREEPAVVAHAAVQSLMQQSMATGQMFACAPPQPDHADSDLKACIQKAKDWLDQQAPPKK